MKVVLFCGGRGMRLREFSEVIPKPMVPLGYRPVLWHVMKYYAHFGHRDFVLCLGYRADAIKQYFLNYDECTSNDFTMHGDRSKLDLHNSDIHDWKITFVDTGADANIGQRLKAVEPHLEGEEYFLANYSDGLTDFHLPDMVESFPASGRIAECLCVKTIQSYHTVRVSDDGRINNIMPISQADIWINGGYFMFNRQIFEYINDGEELVEEPFHRLMDKDLLGGRKYTGFFAGMDTFKDKQMLEELMDREQAPWQVWKARKG
jgi:glucose-1-phosphate cytidylyltransferase